MLPCTPRRVDTFAAENRDADYFSAANASGKSKRPNSKRKIWGTAGIFPGNLLKIFKRSPPGWGRRWASRPGPGLSEPTGALAVSWHGAKEKGVTDFSVTPWHASWWSWRESNPRPLECHANREVQHIEKIIFFGTKSGEPQCISWLQPTVTSRSVAHQPTDSQQAANG